MKKIEQTLPQQFEKDLMKLLRKYKAIGYNDAVQELVITCKMQELPIIETKSYLYERERKMTRFKVGDTVRVIHGDNYAITRTGSEGKIVSLSNFSSGYVYIKFYKTTGRPALLETFSVYIKDIELITKKAKVIK